MRFIVTVVSLLISISAFSQERARTIFRGKTITNIGQAYYDAEREDITVEVKWAPNFAIHDHLTLVNRGDTIAESRIGLLYYEDDKLTYSLVGHFKCRLKEVEYNDKIDEARRKIFFTKAEADIEQFAYDTEVVNYSFEEHKEGVRRDYIMYRDSLSLPTNYTPNYITEVVEWKNRGYIEGRYNAIRSVLTSFSEFYRSYLLSFVKMGSDGKVELNGFEAQYLNMLFGISKDEYDLNGKKIFFRQPHTDITGDKSVYFDGEKLRYANSQQPINAVLYIFTEEQKDECSGYDGAIVSETTHIIPYKEIKSIIDVKKRRDSRKRIVSKIKI